MMMIAKIHGSNVDSIITIVKSQIISKKIEMILVTKTIKTGENGITYINDSV